VARVSVFRDIVESLLCDPVQTRCHLHW